MTESEADFTRTVLAYARLNGWRTAHFRPARTDQGWRTPVQGDGAGFPDLVLVRDRVVVAELKSSKGKVSVEQRGWLQAFDEAGVDAHVWRPRDWDLVHDLLRRPL